MTFRTILIIINVVAFAVIVGIISCSVLSASGANPEPKKPPEPRRRSWTTRSSRGASSSACSGWALLVLHDHRGRLPLYWVLEPSRQSGRGRGLRRARRRAGRGAVRERADGGTTTPPSRCCAPTATASTAAVARRPSTIRPEDPDCDPTADVTDETPRRSACPQQVTWQAPPLDVALLRYPEQQVTEIITYGRPGTPMPAWGVEERQGLAERAGRQRPRRLPREHPDHARRRRRSASASAAIRETEAAEDVDAMPARRSPRRESALARRRPIADAARSGAGGRRRAPRTALDNGHRATTSTVQQASDGRAALRRQCARCHTKGWSYYDPLEPGPAPAPGPRAAALRPQPHRRRRAAAVPGRQPASTEPVRLGRQRQARQQGLRRARHLLRPHAALQSTR